MPQPGALSPNMINTTAGLGGYYAGAAMGAEGGMLASSLGAAAGPVVAAGAYLIGSMFD